MLVSQRDYLLRIIDEVSRIVARVIFKRKAGADQEALETIVVGCERLFGRRADQIFQLTPDHHYLMLTEGEAAEFARDKVLLYASLNAEAGRIYQKQGNAAMARASFLNALRLSLRARTDYPSATLPSFAPSLRELLPALGDAPLDADIATQLAALRARNIDPEGATLPAS
jgi:hypothetical protein